MKIKFTVAFSAMIFGLLIVSATPAKADFLGLAPGDYSLTLNGSTTLCGGANCIGTIHIGSPGATGFSWNITVGGILFNFDLPNAATGVSPNLQNSCAIDASGPTPATACSIADNGSGNSSGQNPALILTHVQTPLVDNYLFVGISVPTAGSWSATSTSAVPEPMSTSLLLFGLGALGVWRRFRVKQD